MNTEAWKQAFINTFQQLFDQFINFIPQFITALCVLVIGIVIAKILGRIIEKLFLMIEHMLARVWQHKQGPETNSILPKAARKAMFWVVILFFVAASIQMIEWPLLNKLVGDIRGYLPRLMIGLLVIFAGFIAGNMAYNTMIHTKTSFEQRFMLGRILQVTIVLTAILIGIEQIGINIELLTNLILIVVGVLLFGFVATFSIGAKESAKNLLALRQNQTLLTLGKTLTIANFSGRIIDITTTQIVLETQNGIVYIPASKLQTEYFVLGHNE